MPSLPQADRNVIQAPEVVLLGAGASIAAQLEWGGSGPRLPSMLNLIEVLGLRDEIEKAGYDPDHSNFEALYDELTCSGKNCDLQKLIESQVYRYFSDLKLPETPTIYDYLVLSLREKDIIASFN